jgi:hypothetical protein
MYSTSISLSSEAVARQDVDGREAEEAEADGQQDRVQHGLLLAVSRARRVGLASGAQLTTGKPSCVDHGQTPALPPVAAYISHGPIGNRDGSGHHLINIS